MNIGRVPSAIHSSCHSISSSISRSSRLLSRRLPLPFASGSGDRSLGLSSRQEKTPSFSEQVGRSYPTVDNLRPTPSIHPLEATRTRRRRRRRRRRIDDTSRTLCHSPRFVARVRRRCGCGGIATPHRLFGVLGFIAEP